MLTTQKPKWSASNRARVVFPEAIGPEINTTCWSAGSRISPNSGAGQAQAFHHSQEKAGRPGHAYAGRTTSKCRAHPLSRNVLAREERTPQCRWAGTKKKARALPRW